MTLKEERSIKLQAVQHIGRLFGEPEWRIRGAEIAAKAADIHEKMLLLGNGEMEASDDEAEKIVDETLEYLELMEAGLDSFIKAQIEAHGDQIIDRQWERKINGEAV